MLLRVVSCFKIEDSHKKSRRESSEETNSASTLTLDFQPPETMKKEYASVYTLGSQPYLKFSLHKRLKGNTYHDSDCYLWVVELGVNNFILLCTLIFKCFAINLYCSRNQRGNIVACESHIQNKRSLQRVNLEAVSENYRQTNYSSISGWTN